MLTGHVAYFLFVNRYLLSYVIEIVTSGLSQTLHICVIRYHYTIHDSFEVISANHIKPEIKSIHFVFISCSAV